MDTSVGGTLRPGAVQLTRKGKIHPCLLRCFSDDDIRLASLTCQCPNASFSETENKHTAYVSLFVGRERVNCRTAHRYRE